MYQIRLVMFAAPWGSGARRLTNASEIVIDADSAASLVCPAPFLDYVYERPPDRGRVSPPFGADQVTNDQLREG
jgi:hypothetical protein